jgi:hypothetical protein
MLNWDSSCFRLTKYYGLIVSLVQPFCVVSVSTHISVPIPMLNCMWIWGPQWQSQSELTCHDSLIAIFFIVLFLMLVQVTF